MEMVILLIAHNIDHAVNRVIFKAQLGGAYILSHIDRNAVTPEQQFLV